MSLLALVAQIVLWHAYHGAEERALERAVAAYNVMAQARGVEVRAVPVPFDAYAQKRAAAIPNGNGPDLFIASHEGLGEWRRDGLVAPLAEPVEEARFVGRSAATLSLQGRAYGLPLAWKSLALYVRTDLVPEPVEKTRELFATARSTYGLVWETGSFYSHAAILHAFGGEVLHEGRPRLDTEAGARALAWVRAQALEGRVVGDASAATALQLFRDGRAAALLSGPWIYEELARARPPIPFRVDRLPAIGDERPMRSFATIDGAFLSARARHPEEAERFARWLATEGAPLRGEGGAQLPCAVAAQSALAADPNLQHLAEEAAASVPMPTDPAMSAVWEPAQEALRKALRGDLSPHVALAAADRRIARALAPPPPAADPRPYLVALGLLVLVGGTLAWRRRAPPVARPTAREGAWAYLVPALVCLLLLVFVPFALGAAMSMFHRVAGPGGGEFVFVGFDNFIALLTSREQPLTDPLSFYFTLLVTIVWTVVNVALHVLIGVSLALLLRDPLLRMRGVYRVLFIVPWAMPSYITALVWKGMFHRQLGAVNALLGLLGIEPVAWFASFWTAFAANVATNVWLGFPFMMVVTLGALARIPREVEEAATLDGATRWQRLRHVILPLLRPGLMPSVVLGAVWTFNMFNVVFLVSGGEPDGSTEILISQAYRWAFGPGRGQRYGYAAAYAVVIFLLLWAQSRLSRRLTEVEP